MKVFAFNAVRDLTRIEFTDHGGYVIDSRNHRKGNKPHCEECEKPDAATMCVFWEDHADLHHGEGCGYLCDPCYAVAKAKQEEVIPL